MEQLNFSKTLLIIPTFNEVDNVGRMLSILFEKYPELHIVVVDDNSPDRTRDKVVELQQLHKNLNLIDREKKRGLASAYITAFKWGLCRDFDYFIQMDCDFSHDPKEVFHLRQDAEVYDLVIGSRYIHGVRITNWPFYRLCLSYLASLYVQLISRAPIKDPTSGLKCFKRIALENIDLDRIISEGYIFQFELSFKVWARNLSIKERPIVFNERRDGTSKLGRSIILEAFINVLRLKLKHVFKAL